MQILAYQLYPSSVEPTMIQSIRKIRWEETEAALVPLNDIAKDLNYEPVSIEANNQKFFAYRGSIPTHSDY